MWTPEINTPDIEPLITNLLQFFEDNQVDALRWANGDQPLPKFEKIYKSVEGRVNTHSRSLMVVESVAATPHAEDLNQTIWRIEFEYFLTSGNADLLAVQKYRYAKAVESMLLNCETLTANSDFAQDFNIGQIETDYQELKTNGTIYAQTMRTRIEYTVFGSSYNEG